MSILILILIAVLFFCVSLYSDNKKFVENLPQGFLKSAQRRDKTNKLREKIYKSNSLEEQKKLAYEIYDLNGHDTVYIKDCGYLAGIINRHYYVFLTDDKSLKAVSYQCLKQKLNKYYPKGVMPLSVESFAVETLRTTTGIRRPRMSSRGRPMPDTEELPFVGQQPVCEMPCCVKEA